jgi:GTPase SAR1 family protein
VGCKTDLRDDTVSIEELIKIQRKPVSIEEVPVILQLAVANFQRKALAEELGVTKYLECCSILNDGVREVFEEAVRAALLKNKIKNKTCTLI